MRSQGHAPTALYPRERPGTRYTGGWLGHRAVLDRCGKSRSHWDSIRNRPARSQSLYRLSYPGHEPYLVLLNKNFSDLLIIEGLNEQRSVATVTV